MWNDILRRVDAVERILVGFSWRRWIYWAFFAISLLFLVLCLYVVANTVNFGFPLHDEWRLFQRWGEADNLFDAAIIRHNQYYLILLNILSYIDIRLFEYSGYFVLLLSWVALVLIGVTLYKSFDGIGSFSKNQSIIYASLLVILMTLLWGPMNNKTTLWTLHVIIALSFLFSVTAMYFAARPGPMSWKMAILTQLGAPVLAFLANPNGGLVAIVLVVYWALQGRKREAILAGIATVLYGLFLSAMPALPGVGELSFVSKFGGAILVALGEIGSFVHFPRRWECWDMVTVAAGVGAILTLYTLFVWLRWLVLDQRKFASRAHAYGALLMLLGVVTAASIGLARTPGLDQCPSVALAPRYYMWSLMVLIGFIAHVLASVRRWEAGMLAVLAFATAISLYSYAGKIDDVGFLRARQIESEQTLVLQLPEDRAWTLEHFPVQNLVMDGRDWLRQNRLSLFTRLGWISEQSLPQLDGIADCAGEITNLSVVGDIGLWRIQGWSTAIDRTGTANQVLLFNADTSELIGLARHTQPPRRMPANLDNRRALRGMMRLLTRSQYILNAEQGDYGFGGIALGTEDEVRNAHVIAFDSHSHLPVCALQLPG